MALAQTEPTGWSTAPAEPLPVRLLLVLHCLVEPLMLCRSRRPHLAAFSTALHFVYAVGYPVYPMRLALDRMTKEGHSNAAHLPDHPLRHDTRGKPLLAHSACHDLLLAVVERVEVVQRYRFF